MKKLGLTTLLALGAAAMVPCQGLGADIIHEGIAYSFYEGVSGSVYVTYPEEDQTSLVEYQGDIVIPESFIYEETEVKVEGIGDNAFKDRTMITSVSLPSTVTSIGEAAFSNCRRMTVCQLPENLKEIGRQSFYYCQGLEEVTLPAGIGFIPAYSFAFCQNLKKAVIDGQIDSIDEYAFFKDSELTSITLPEGLLCIWDQAFSECLKLSEITFPETLRIIGNGTFYNNQSISALDFSKLRQIGMNAFAGCKGLVEIDLSRLKGASIGSGAFLGCSGAEYVSLPEISALPALLFADCTKMDYLELPAGLSSIGDRCFSGCVSIENIKIPKTVTEIGEYAFSGCASAETLEGLDHEMTLGEGAFQGLLGIHKLNLTDIKEIPKDAFAHCRGLKELEINSGVERIAAGAFTDCPDLTTISVEGLIPPVISVNTFDDATERSATLKVDPDAVVIFSQASQWNRFMNIEGSTDLPWSGIETTVPTFITISSGEIISDGTGEIIVFDIQGHLCGVLGHGMDSLSLPKGIYILQSPHHTAKVKI